MNTSTPNRQSFRNVLGRLLQFVRPYRMGFIVAMMLLIAKLVMDVGFATVQQLFIDTITSADMSALLRLTMICGIVCLLVLVCLMLQHYLRFVVQFRMVWDLRASLFDKSNRLPFRVLQSMHSGDLSSRNNKDADKAMDMVGSVVYDLAYNILLCFVSFLYLARMDIWISLLALGSGPVVFLSGRFFDRRLRVLSGDILMKEAELRALLQEVLQGMKVVRAFGLEGPLLNRYVEKREQLNVLQRKRTILSGLLWQTSAFVNNTVMVACAGLIAYSSLHGGTTAGGVLAFIILMGRVQWPFVHMSQTWGGVQESLGASDRVFAVLDMPSEREEKSPEAAESHLLSDKEALSMNHVYFNHRSSDGVDTPLFKGLNLRVVPGETVAVVGPSGSGKSTLIRLCCGLYEPDQGSVSLFGSPLHEHLESTREFTTYVPQIPYLFSGTIRDNLIFGADGATDEEIIEAARLAGAEEFIAKLPDGYDTVLGEHGSTLSGGQRQRLAIARAFLRKAPLLLLDEATSALDNESEELVQHSLDLLMRERTTVVIAHRLSTVRNASRIIVLDRGEIVEEGTHDDLMEQEGMYAGLYRIQFQEKDKVQETA
ncbi:ABC transporter ATP-binding protein [Paenibacillus segetis]|uniref:Multidrug export ATP-binding/permease protein YgaD n=1 Tax=Paenibacillus segetis TaxID=1325360 RepID=A0ABQ1YJ93_9BACL|nr:ABC transporter ATP-binding protein [Paenibacillus segetis]GGH28344.1 putative multidrug export ATP-binding/permease protein YgaD [Paenibacillus segetis]